MLDDITTFAAAWAMAAVGGIDRLTGCDRYGACPAWHGAVGLVRQYRWIGWALAAFVLLLVLPPLVRLGWALFWRWWYEGVFARFMRGYEAYRAELFRPGSGFLLGDLARGMIRPLRVRGDASILTFGGAGTGKGVGLVMPNCLGLRWQVIVDWGAEIATVCAPVWRRRGVQVVVVNPCRAFTSAPWFLPVHRFNPLAGIDPDMPGFGARCRAVADSLFIRTGREGDPFWLDAGVAMADFVMRQVIVMHRDAATLLLVYGAILGGLAKQEEFFGEMARSEDPFIQNAGNRLLQMLKAGSRTIASIVQQVETKLSWMADDRFVDSLSGHDVDFDALRGHGAGRRGCVVVFVLQPNLAASHGAWLKVCLNAVISAMVDEPPKHKVLLTIDECSVLGNWHWIEQGMAILRKYKVQLHCIYQSMGQAQEAFGDKLNSMMANAYIKNFVGINDPLTAKYLSETLGFKEDGTALMSADQLGRMRQGEQVTLLRGQRPILVQNRPYYHRVLMRRGVGKNPYHKGLPRLPALYPVWLLKGLLMTLWASARPTPRQIVLMALLFWWRDAWTNF